MPKTDAIVKGALFKNDRKESPNHPDMTGPCDMGDRKLRIAAWKQTKDGNTYLSFEITEPQQQKQEEAQGADLDDVLGDGY